MQETNTLAKSVKSGFYTTLILAICTIMFQNPVSVMALVDLKIPDREWDSTRTNRSVGWCAEACIQMAMKYYGYSVTQKEINMAGKPKHSDLYMDDIDVALNQLSVKSIPWKSSNRDIRDFIRWIKTMLDFKYPVICGVKIYPDKHPHWFLDHFVLIAGYNDTGFIVNTNMYGQKNISYQSLMSAKKGFSFRNKHRKYFARAVTCVDRK